MIRALFLGAMLITSTQAAAAGISTVTGRLTLWGSDGGGFDLVQPLEVPTSLAASYTNPQNGSYANAQYAILSSGIDITYSLLRTRHNDDLPLENAQANGYVQFTVDAPAPYILAGEMNTIDPDGRNTTQWLRLYDGNQIVFDNFQLSRATINPHFYLGNEDGDDFNVLTGSLTGMLFPGHSYQFEYFSRIIDEPATSLSTATATGFYRLTIVPEPSTAILLFVGLFALGKIDVYRE